MKKFSTIAQCLAQSVVAGLFPVFTGISIVATGALSVTSAYAASETTAQKSQCAFLPGAPDQHVVVEGDTLWGISSLFLEHPWCWPRVWGMNRQQIKNPHWIYPGQIVYFDRVAGRLKLGQPVNGKTVSGVNSGVPTVRLSPQVRTENLADNAITTIPAKAIEPFLSQPLVLEESDFSGKPHVVSASPGHLNVGKSEKVYVVGDLGGQTSFQVYRPATPMIDPFSKKILGYESVYAGTVKLIRAGKTPDEAHSFLVIDSKEEISVGDSLLPVPNMELTNYVPHPPENPAHGHILSIYGGVAQAGQNQTVAINLGSENDMDIGTVLKIYRWGEWVHDKTKKDGSVKLPDEEYGTLFIYRVFKHVSYGLIMDVTDSVQVGDVVSNPS